MSLGKELWLCIDSGLKIVRPLAQDVDVMNLKFLPQITQAYGRCQ